MGLVNIQIDIMTLSILATLFAALLVAFQFHITKAKRDLGDLKSRLITESHLLNESIKKISTYQENEGVLKREIGSCNTIISDLKDEISVLNEDLEHASKNSSDFENEMGNAQLEVLELKDKNKILAAKFEALKADNDELSKKLHSQKAHFGKQKKKIESLQGQVKELDRSNYILEGVLSEALKVGYFVWQGKYHKAIPVTAPKEKKLAREKIDEELQKLQRII